MVECFQMGENFLKKLAYRFPNSVMLHPYEDKRYLTTSNIIISRLFLRMLPASSSLPLNIILVLLLEVIRCLYNGDDPLTIAGIERFIYLEAVAATAAVAVALLSEHASCSTFLNSRNTYGLLL
ncbi:hypothetical protein ACO02O_08966 [Dirofilaria immitis]